MPSELSNLPPAVGAIVLIAWLVITTVMARRDRASQRWAGAVHAAIQLARGSKQPDWLLHLETCFEKAYEKTHGKKPGEKLRQRGVADMANIISNHLLTHNQEGVAGDFHAVLEKQFMPPEDQELANIKEVHIATDAPPPSVQITRSEPRETIVSGLAPGGTPRIPPPPPPGPDGKRPMRRFSVGINPTIQLLMVAVLAAGAACAEDEAPKPIDATVESIAFAPNGSSKLGYGDCDCTATVVDVLDHAKKTVLVQAYNFTSEPIAKALCAAKKRGVDVRIIGDRSVPTERSSKAQDCADAAIPVLIDKKHHIAHNKVIIVDGETTITGSFNWTDSAEDNNAENLLVIKSAAIAAIYTANWKKHAEHAEPFKKGE